jgi:adenylate cyclase
VEEIVQSLVESGALVGQPGDYELVREVTELGVPSTVEAVLAARIDRLAEREKWVLQCASVVGPVFAEDELAHITDLTAEELRGCLQALVAGEFILEHALYPRLEFAFKHALTRDVAYRSQLQETRARSHAAVAKSIEALRAEHMEERYALLAHHWELAREPVRAAQWALRAAVWSRDSDAAEAARQYRKVLELVNADGEDEDAARWVLAACIGLLRAAVATGVEVDEPRRLLRRGCAAAERLGSRRELVELQSAYARVSSAFGEEAVEEAREAARLADELGDAPLRVWTLAELSTVEWLFGPSLEVAVDAIETALAEAPDSFQALRQRGLLLLEAGRLGEARRDIERADELKPESAPTGSHIAQLVCQSILELRCGALDAAEALATRGLELSERCQNRNGIAQALLRIGDCYLRTNRQDQAVDWLTRSVDVIRGLGVNRYGGFWAQAKLAMLYSELGHDDRAAEVVASLARQVEHLIEARVDLTFAMIGLSEPGKLEEAEVYLERSEQAAKAKGVLYFRAPFLECRAALERRRGDEPAALRQLRAAQQCYAEMGASGHAERLARELGA